MNAITRPCYLSYFWSSRRISASNLLLTAVRDYNFGNVVLTESTIVAVLPRTTFY